MSCGSRNLTLNGLMSMSSGVVGGGKGRPSRTNPPTSYSLNCDPSEPYTSGDEEDDDDDDDDDKDVDKDDDGDDVDEAGGAGGAGDLEDELPHSPSSQANWCPSPPPLLPSPSSAPPPNNPSLTRCTSVVSMAVMAESAVNPIPARQPKACTRTSS